MKAERLLFAAAPEFPALLGLGWSRGTVGELGLPSFGQRVDVGTPYLVLSSAPGLSLAQMLSDPALSALAR